VLDEIDTDGLSRARDALFAEAYARAKAGERYWPTGEEQRELFDPEQVERESPEVYTEILARWLADPKYWELAVGSKTEFTMADAIEHGLKIDAKGITRDIQTRVGTALAKLGCERKEYRTRPIRHWYVRPKLNLHTQQYEAVAETEGLPV
jgi:putative DNA primase/helicase